MTPFKIAQGDLSFQAEFAQPAFELFENRSKPYRALFAALARHGLRLTDMRPEKGSGTLGDAYLQCTLFDFTTSLRVRLERLELTCLDLKRVDRTQLEELIVDSLEARSRVFPSEISFKTYGLSISLHGLLPVRDVKEFLAGFLKTVPQNLGPPVGSGCVFYYGAEGEQVTFSLALDLSAAVANGLFVRLYMVWDAGRLAIKAIPEAVAKRLKSTFAQVELELVEGSREYHWLASHGTAYRGRWVAVDGETLVAQAASFKELQAAIRALELTRCPLVHRVA